MWQQILYFMLYLYCVNSDDNTELFMPDHGKIGSSKFDSIIKCIISISDIVLQFRPTVAILQQRGKGTEEYVFINELIEKLVEYNIPQMKYQDINNEENHNLHLGTLIIAFFDTYQDIINSGFSKVTKDMKFLVIIWDPSNYDWNTNLREIGKKVAKYDITFLVKDFLEDKNKIITIFPQIDKNSCKETTDEPAHINTCFNGTVQNREVFAIKNPTNLNKCPLKVGMGNLYPFSTITDKELLKNYDLIENIKGSDYEVMKIVAKYFNATLNLHYINKSEENPFNDTDFLEFLFNGSLELCSGGLYRIYGNTVEYSGVYISEDIMWIYHAERADRSWESLIQKMGGLYIFFMCYVIYSFVWYIVCLFDKNTVSLTKTLLHGWGALVGATSLQDARSFKQKLLNIMYLLMCIYLSAYINLQLYSFLTIRGPPRIFKTNDEVMESGLKPVLKPTSKYFVSDEKYLKFADTSEDCDSFLDCALKTLNSNGLTVYLQGYFLIFQAKTAVNDEARILRATENVLTVYHEMVIRNTSNLVVKFQKVIQRLFEAGITRRLYIEALGLTVVAKANIASSNMMANSYSCQAGCSITFMQFAGVFYVWIFGCILSSIVFAIEILSKRERKL